MCNSLMRKQKPKNCILFFLPTYDLYRCVDTHQWQPLNGRYSSLTGRSLETGVCLLLAVS